MSKVLGIEALAGIRDWVKSEDDAVKAELQAQIGSPLVASTVAGMTDQTKVYVYTGSETGYTAGNWYYYNGSAWTSGGVYNSTALETDPTLTIEGMAADAKATGDEITHVKQDINELETGKADASGTYENLTAGNAEQLLTDKGITDKVPYLLRASGGNGADRERDEIVGGTVAWNQLLPLRVIPSTTTVNGITFTNNGNGSVTVNGTNNGSSSALFIFSSILPKIPNGHKIMLVGSKSMGGWGEWTFYNTPMTVSSAVGSVGARIYAQHDDLDSIFAVAVWAGKTVNNVTFYPLFIDLTQMFGTAIADRAYAMEQATAGSGINWLKSMGFFTADYYPYDAGTLKSVEGLTAHSMVGFNQWDEEWEVGGIDSSTGQNDSSTNGIRTKNYISVMPNTTYYCYVSGLTSSNCKTRWYDANKNYIGISPSMYYGNTFVTPSNARYVRFCPQDTYGTTYKHDICINISNSAKNGTYEPYVKHSYPLDSTLTLRGIPKLDSNNQVYYDGDTYKNDGTVERRYGVVTLDGTEPWIKSTSYVGNYYFSMRRTVTTQAYAKEATLNIITTNGFKPVNTSQALASNDLCILIDGGNIPNINIKNTSKETLDSFKSWLASNPMTIVYELATSTTEEAEPYQNPQIVDPYGTEEYETTGIVPVGHETFYPENLRKKIEGLPFNFATLIAPTESTYKATRAYSTNNLFIVDNVLYKATASIASGGTITPGTNCTATTLAEIIATLS